MKEVASGMFITFEGLDGAGKSTQIERLLERLQHAGHEVLHTREPGGTTIGDDIRNLLLRHHRPAMTPEAEALLYAASRAQHVQEVLVPALERGAIVLCDRYVDASIAYQGAGLELGVAAVRTINDFATGGLTPDFTVLFDVAVAVSKARIALGRGEVGPDRIEVRDEAYFDRVRTAFLQLAQDHPERVAVVDATLSPEHLEQEIWALIANRISR